MARDLTKIEKNLLNFALKGTLQKKREAWRTVHEELRLQRFFYHKFLNDSPIMHRVDADGGLGVIEGTNKKNRRRGLGNKKSGLSKGEMIQMKIRMCKQQAHKIEEEILFEIDRGN